MVPDWRLGGWGHPWRHGLSWYVIFDLCAKFQLSSMIRKVSRTPILEVHTWMMLKVSEWSLEGWGHSWHVGSSWEIPRNLPWKFHQDPTSFGWVISYKVLDKGTDIHSTFLLFIWTGHVMIYCYVFHVRIVIRYSYHFSLKHEQQSSMRPVILIEFQE